MSAGDRIGFALVSACVLAAACGGAEFSANGGEAGSAAQGTGGTGGTGASGGTGGAGTGGGGTGGATCLDNDDDGQTECDGDCDNSDPLTFVGATEICGDELDNDCDGDADQICNGLGTFVSANVGDDANPGTQAAPVASIAQGMSNAQTIGSGVDVFVAQGHYAEKVILLDDISLFGGHQCDQTTCSWERDPTTYDTAILAQDADGVYADAQITRVTRFDGFRVMGQDGAAAGAPGRSAITIESGTPVIANCQIFAPTVTGGDYRTGRAIGIAVLAPQNDPRGVLIEDNVITGGTAAVNATALLMDARITPVAGTSEAIIRGNTLGGGTGNSVAAIGAHTSGPGTLIERNQIEAGVATVAAAWGIEFTGALTIDRNYINTRGSGSCQSTQPCGGIQSESGTAVITNNVILGIAGPWSVGVHLGEFERPAGEIVLNGNTIDGSPIANATGGVAPKVSAIVLSIGACTTCGFNARVGRIRNNVLVARAGGTRSVVFEEAGPGQTQHPELMENNLFFLPAPTPSDALYRYFDGVSPTLYTTVTQINALPSVPSGANLSADPALDSTFHLGSGSPCIDKGTTTEAPSSDIDGDSRPQANGIDIGADEAN